MAIQIIPFDPKNKYNSEPKEDDRHLHISEFFCDSIQGEGIYTGVPASFLRLSKCVFDCVWCDTKEIFASAVYVTFDDLFARMQNVGLINKLIHGQHLVITGGSPLLQQYRLATFLREFVHRYGFKPFIELENECSMMPMAALVSLVDCWNNSPKLNNSGIPASRRINPSVIETMSGMNNSWFKFVVDSERDWEEIAYTFINTGLINQNQIILMPKGSSREELEANREMVVQMAIEHRVRYSTREHIVLWDKQKGV